MLHAFLAKQLENYIKEFLAIYLKEKEGERKKEGKKKRISQHKIEASYNPACCEMCVAYLWDHENLFI